MPTEAHLEVKLEQSIHFKSIHQRRLSREVSFSFLKWTFRSINMNFVALPDSFEALVVHGGHRLVLGDPSPPKQQMIRDTSINDMKTHSCSHRPTNELKSDVAERKRSVVSKT